MSLRLRIVAFAFLVSVVFVGTFALGGFGPVVVVGPGASPTPATQSDGSELPTVEPTIEPTPTPRPVAGGTELYGFLPYWEMTETMATYLEATPLSTLALFSATARKNGAINTSATGYRRVNGPIGERLISGAHKHDARVDIVFTSFGTARNAAFFGRSGTAPTAAPAPTAFGAS